MQLPVKQRKHVNMESGRVLGCHGLEGVHCLFPRLDKSPPKGLNTKDCAGICQAAESAFPDPVDRWLRGLQAP